ncbi:MAG: hypothetical protein ACK5Z1_05185 [Gemmatimonadota bacterium]
MTPRSRTSVRAAVLTATALFAACTPARVRERPIMVNSDRVANTDSLVAAAAARGEADRARLEARRESLMQVAMSPCNGGTCAALARGEVVLGMNSAQVMAATRTTPEAWTVRVAGPATIMTPRTLSRTPRDNSGELAMVQLQNGGVSTYAYRERQGLRVVATAADTGITARNRVLADRLQKEGDDFLSAGDRALALDRYDRALLLNPDDYGLEYKVASLLDLQLRPVEALMRYQRFLQQLELQRIDAQGTQAAKLTEAVVRAQQRIVILRQETEAAPPPATPPPAGQPPVDPQD